MLPRTFDSSRAGYRSRYKNAPEGKAMQPPAQIWGFVLKETKNKQRKEGREEGREDRVSEETRKREPGRGTQPRTTAMLYRGARATPKHRDGGGNQKTRHCCLAAQTVAAGGRHSLPLCTWVAQFSRPRQVPGPGISMVRTQKVEESPAQWGHAGGAPGWTVPRTADPTQTRAWTPMPPTFEPAWMALKIWMASKTTG